MKKTSMINKTMSKRALKEYHALSRSTVAMGRNLGTRIEKSIRDYDRNRVKTETRKMAARL